MKPSPIRTFAAMALAAVLAVGCNKSEQSNSAAGGGDNGKKTIVIGLIGKSQSNPVFQAARVGAEDAAKELGDKYNANIQISWQTPADEDAQKQAEAIDALQRQGASGISVSCSEAGTVTPAINRAVDAGTVVMCFDSDAPKSKRFCYYGTDDTDCGKAVIGELAKVMDNKGNIAILAGNQSAPNLQARAQAVRDEVANNYKDMKIIDTVYHKETPADALEAVKTFQNTHPEVQGWAMVGGWPLFTKSPLPWPAGSVKVVSVDALPEQLDYLKSGQVQVLLAQDCYGWGHKSVEILMEKIVNKKDPSSEKIISPLTKVTKDNADEYGKNWDKWIKK